MFGIWGVGIPVGVVAEGLSEIPSIPIVPAPANDPQPGSYKGDRVVYMCGCGATEFELWAYGPPRCARCGAKAEAWVDGW